MKKNIIKYIIVGVAIAGIFFGIGRAKFLKTSNDVTVATFKVQATPERLARGEYLANHVTLCVDCHSQRDWSYHSAPVIAGTEGAGGQRFGPEFQMPGILYSRNITPKGIGHWTDAELIQALTQGINKDGETLFPLMPYLFFRELSQEDLFSIIAYIRSLKPVDYQPPKRELVAPIEVLVSSTPPPWTPKPTPDRKNTVEYGKYLVTVASCYECHTQMENGEFITDMAFAGGYRFDLPSGNTAFSQNITPDVETGIGSWDRQTFINVFKAYSYEEIRKHRLPEGTNNTIMPWSMFSGMTEEDLGAIYDYLRTIKPVKNKVERFVRSGS